MNEYEKYKLEFKDKKRNVTVKGTSILFKYISKCLITVILTLITLIALKWNKEFRSIFYKEVYEKSFSFVEANKYYEKIFGSPIPFIDLLKIETLPVFKEQLVYKSKEDYLDGVKLGVDENYLVPALETGMVVFIGDKDDLPNTVIISQINGIDVWYTNVTNLNVNVYDYVEKGSFLGNTIGNNLILSFKNDKGKLDYNEYIKN